MGHTAICTFWEINTPENKKAGMDRVNVLVDSNFIGGTRVVMYILSGGFY